MGILQDIFTNIKDVKDIAKEIKFNSDAMRRNSIAKMSAESTLQFPVIVSRSLDVDTAQSVTKALERQYATFVQLVIALNPYLDLNKDRDMKSYLGRIHQNNPRMMDVLDESCINVYTDEHIGLSILFSLNEGCNGNVLSNNRKQLFSVEECLNKNTINNLYQPEEMTYAVAEASLKHYCSKNNILMEALPTDAEIDAATDQLELQRLRLKADTTRAREDARVRRVDRATKRQNELDDARLKVAQQDARDQRLRNEKLADDATRNAREDARDQRLRREKLADDATRERNALNRLEIEQRSKAMVRLSDNDVKKANELVPTTISLSMSVTKGDNFGGIQNFIIGVKGIMHPVQSNEMVSNLLNGFKTGSAFFNFLRWTSGEIKFLKDLVFNVNEIREDVIKKHSGGSHWWLILKRRKAASRFKSMVNNKNAILPNATIVCSMEEIIELKETYGLDAMNVKNVRKLMDEFFLLGFVIVDRSQELCYFMFDGETDFQTVSFRGMEKENDSKNDFKEIYKMINSGRL